MPSTYFDPLMQRRQVLLWALAARRQLDRWEPLVLANVKSQLNGPQMLDHLIWQGEAEHHFALVAFDHMLDAVEMWDFHVVLPEIVVQEVAEVRDLAMHWAENMPIFNVSPRPREPGYRTGKSFAKRNPSRSPYSWWNWTGSRGAMLTINVAAADAREAVQAVEDAVLAEDPGLARFIEPERPSPPASVW